MATFLYNGGEGAEWWAPICRGVVAAAREGDEWEVGASVVYDPGGNPDGFDVIITGRIAVSLLRVTMVLEDGVWKLSSGTTIEDLEAPAACDAY